MVEVHEDAPAEPYPVPPPPPDPLPPPEPEVTEDEESSVRSEYENELEIPDDDMSTVAPYDASVLIYSISERIARDRAIEAARQRSDTIFGGGPHREAHRGTALTYLHRDWTARNAINL